MVLDNTYGCFCCKFPSRWSLLRFSVAAVAVEGRNEKQWLNSNPPSSETKLTEGPTVSPVHHTQEGEGAAKETAASCLCGGLGRGGSLIPSQRPTLQPLFHGVSISFKIPPFIGTDRWHGDLKEPTPHPWDARASETMGRCKA